MTDSLEFHDSTLTAIHASASTVELHLNGYIHRWEDLGDRWRGTGWQQRVFIMVSNPRAAPVEPLLPARSQTAACASPLAAPVTIVRLPFKWWGNVRLRLELTLPDVVEVSGDAVCIEVADTARYVEDLPDDLRPLDRA